MDLDHSKLILAAIYEIQRASPFGYNQNKVDKVLNEIVTLFETQSPDVILNIFLLLYNFDHSYHNGNALVEDFFYDALILYAKKLYPDNPYFKKVGAPVRTGKERLPVSLGSLDQLHDDNEINNWIKKYNLTDKQVVITEKLDGYSCLLVYNDGKLVNAYSRGDGVEGASVLRHVHHIPSIPKHLDDDMLWYDKLWYIRGEIILNDVSFTEKYKDKFKNSRNMVAGCMNRIVTEQSILNDFSFIAHEWINTNTTKHISLEILENFKFNIPNYINMIGNELNTITLTKLIHAFKKESNFTLDGIVVTINALQDVIEVSKSSSLNPEHSIKFKLVAENAEGIETEVVAVLWEPSKNNLIKPRIQIKPVDIDGVTITYATGNNAKFIVDNNIGKGAIVKIIRSGGVIPKCEMVIKGTTPDLPTDISWEWNENKVEIVLTDKNSSEVIFKQVLDFFTSLEVELFKEASLRSLFDTYDLSNENYTNILGTIFDLIEIEFEKVLGVNGKKIYANLHKKLQHLTLPILLGSLNYFGTGVGIRKVSILLEQISFEELTKATVQQLEELRGFDTKTATLIIAGLPQVIAFLDKFKDYLNFGQNEEKTSELAKVIVVMTGFRDKELHQKIEAMGGKVGSSVSGKTTHLLAAGKSIAEGSTKLDKAKELGIVVMTPEQFKELFNL